MADLDWFTNLAVHGTLPGLRDKLWSQMAIHERLKLTRDPQSPSLRASEAIVAKLHAGYRVRTMWTADRVEEWVRLVESGCSAVVAEQAVIDIHAQPAERAGQQRSATS